MDWFLYDNGPRHERVKISDEQLPLLTIAVFQHFSTLYEKQERKKESRENIYVVSKTKLGF